MRAIKAVLSDMDGTLVDSELEHAKAWDVVLAKYGLLMPEGWQDDCIGMPEEHALAKINSIHPHMEAVPDLIEQRQACYFEHVKKHGMEMVYPGIFGLLQDLADTELKMAIITNSVSECAQKVMDATGLDRYFSFIITKDMVKHGKPEPEIYLAGAAKLGIRPDECVVIEDSPAGIIAGKAAGCLVLGVKNNTDGSELGKADVIFDRSRDAMAWVLAKRTRSQSLRRVVNSVKPVRVEAVSTRFVYSPVTV
jgi:haloacid dehalogenase superfamily, subfamily IA, variant 3 with third motif having DD or ED/haloacid dehalogenase superfamily, subfamily IA, variant 1 with third motif having Dx(3-4)D or Dx(3-4)E